MTERVLIDIDVIIKVVAYGLGRELVETTSVAETPPAMLHVGRFVVRDRLARGCGVADVPAASAVFEQLLSEIILVEPTDEELAAAAEFESAATRQNLELDGGESQLLAVLLVRGCNLLLTGDKRAIRAIAAVAGARAAGRVACLEQLLAEIVRRFDVEEIRGRVCRETAADKAVSICFGCLSALTPNRDDILAALQSYTNDVEKDAADILLSRWDLSALPAQENGVRIE